MQLLASWYTIKNMDSIYFVKDTLNQKPVIKLPKIFYAEGRSGAQWVPQHQVLQSSVLLILRQTLAGQNLSPLPRQFFQLLQETGPADGRRV